jgi:hypothetical protein
MRRSFLVLAAGIVVAAFAAMPPAAATPPPAKSSCVGLVVDTGHAVRSTCVPFKAGMTGQQLLQKAGHSLAFGDGFVCQIDGFPARCHSDKTHYWSYYLRAPNAAANKWTYSAKGANVEKVRAGETEGWAYVDGKDRTPKAPAYATLVQAARSTPASAKSNDASADGSSGVPWALIIGIVVLVAVIAAGLWQVRVRRNRA